MTKKYYLYFAIIVGLCGYIHAACADEQVRLGVAGFYDHYREPGPDLDVTDNSKYGAITADYIHTVNNHYFFDIDGTLAYGTDHYKSPGDGTSSGSSQYESGLRISGGPIFPFMNGTIGLYSGLGGRFFTISLRDRSRISDPMAITAALCRYISRLAPAGIFHWVTATPFLPCLNMIV